MTKAKANHLIKSNSPYLLQHAYNPVSWYPWSEEALAEAKRRNVPIILSIGYSSCHWCHVMERESFENEELAGIMNDHFVSIKVDREERPDIDQIYMEAIQTMGIQGGWPLNVFLTPDQKPFYGGTYFPPAQWRQVCLGVSNAYQNNNKQIKESAEQFFEELNHSELKKYGIAPREVNIDLSEVKKMASALKSRFDPKYGGMDKAPKFPMPAMWKFLLYANVHLMDQELEKHLQHTLTSMSNGGIYDQIGGGFARYSVDERWFAPHFEKMLYDNGQLLSLYSEAYKAYPNESYKEVVYESINFLERELMDVSGGFYSALDADSEGVEGLFYIWSEAELKDVLEDDFPLFSDYYNVVPEGNWEHSRNILYKTESDQTFSEKHEIGEEELKEKIKSWKNKLLMIRSGKIRPGLDDKILSGWNGLALKGLTDAYRTFGEQKFLDLAVKNAMFLKENMMQEGELYRNFKAGEVSIKGYLEDYAFVIDGLIGLYQCNFNKDWLELAKKLASHCLDHFYDSEEGMFFYTANNSEKLIARKKEIFDNVIPASNSQMAINLYLLSKFYYEDRYEKISQEMLAGMTNLIVREPSYLTNWAILYLFHSVDFPEIAIVGNDPESKAAELDKLPLYNKIIAAGKAGSALPVLRERQAVKDKNTIYVCFNKTCKLPVHTLEDAKKQLSIE